MNFKQTLRAISATKHVFGKHLSESLNLVKVEAPLIVRTSSGLNDNLNGIEAPVKVGTDFQVVQSLAKWKRYALQRYGFKPGEGIVTDMRALRPDEKRGIMHSIYVDQFDWEKVITREDRTEKYLHETVKDIYSTLRYTELVMSKTSGLDRVLPKNITFTTAQELEDMWPDMTPVEREYFFCRQHDAIFVQGVGKNLNHSGKPHDGRAPDYDDWYNGLNGDIVVWNPILNRPIELSSMGIRVDETSLAKQVNIRGVKQLSPFHKAILNKQLPLTIGGGIGQSRLCMFLLQKKHIGQVQASVWDDDKDML